MEKQGTILIVDDLNINRQVLRTLFENEFDILEAENGTEALKLIEQHKNSLSVIILDIVMPELDGFGVLAGMKKSGTIDEVPVVMITVYSETENEMKALTDGATEILLKPIEPVIVKKRVWNVINLFRYRKHLESTIDGQKRMLDLIRGSIAGGTITTLDDEGYTILSMNDELLNRYGYESIDEINADYGGKYVGLIHPDDTSYVRDYIDSSIKRGKRYEITYRVRKKNGKYIWIIENGQPAVSPDGKPAISSVCVDIDRQIELQKELIEKENSLNNKQLELVSFEEMAPGGVFHASVDDNVTVTRANANFYKYMDFSQPYDGMNRTSVTMRDLIAPKDFTRYLKKIRSSLDKCASSFSMELCIITQKGKKKWIITNGRFIINNGRPEIYSIIIDHTSEHEAGEYLRLSEERFRIALSRTKNVIIDYDVRCGEFELSEKADEVFGTERVIYGTPEAFIENGIILRQDSVDFLDMFTALNEGAQSASCTVRTLHKSMSPHWSKITFNAIRGDDGELVRAIGFIEDISEINIFNGNEASDSSEVLASYSVNITKDRIWSAKEDDNDNIKAEVGVTYIDLIEYVAGKAVKAEEHAEILKKLDIDVIKRYAKDGDFIHSYEYHRSGSDGKIKWVRLSVNCTKSENGDVFALIYIRDIDSKKKKELSLVERAERDELTGLYNPRTTASMINTILKNGSADGNASAVFSAEITNYQSLIECFGQKYTNGLVAQTAKLIVNEFGQTSVIGKMEENRFAGLISGASHENIVKKTEEVCGRIISRKFADDYAESEIKIVFGLSYADENGKQFKKLYDEADTAQKTAVLNGENVNVYSENTPSIIDGEMTSDGTKLLMRCLSTVCSGGSKEELFGRLMGELGAFFGAERCYSFEFNESGMAEIGVEWLAEGVKSHKQESSETQVYSVSRWIKSCRENKPFNIEDIEAIREESPLEYEYFAGLGVKSIYAAPYIAADMTGCFICLDNATKNLNSFGLFVGIAQHIAYQIEKRSKDNKECCEEMDALTGAYSRKMVVERVNALSEETLSSVGIIVMDINGTKRINDELGQEFGDDAIRKTGMILRKFFGTDVFRISGDEFLVICTDITRTYFIERVETLKQELDEIGPYGVSIGSTWSDVDINLTQLRKRADEKLLIDKQDYYMRVGQTSRHKNSNVLNGLLSALHEGMYHVFLQPKADIKTGKIIGAEALVRLIHPVQGVVPPMKFIPLFEKEHVISYLDLFMFEEVCKLLRSWTAEGRKLIPVSLNFSRITVLEPEIVEKIEQIQERYGVPREYIEIEVTESVGEMEKETIAQISDKIIEKGYRTSLDDFGSKYTNISILAVMRFHILKLDKSLVNDIVANPVNQVIVEHVIKMCHELGVKVVAEGVETEEQLKTLDEKKCDYAQGYLFNKPIPSEGFTEKYM